MGLVFRGACSFVCPARLWNGYPHSHCLLDITNRRWKGLVADLSLADWDTPDREFDECGRYHRRVVVDLPAY